PGRELREPADPRPRAAGDQAMKVGLRRRFVFVSAAALLAGCSDDSPPPAPAPVPSASYAPAPAKSAVEEPAPELRYRDVTRAAGIDFTHETGAYGEKLLPETM